ncbi:beta-glucosidase [Bacillus lacus]|uniref:beta-glucosidase n=1 Tax=Metabacillus lacus TaxID=1983721 RepID=A0A7X2IXV2_9BACI|nr:glycoside hydrolase family 3 N-terminal domain-containing protein [Metabacillus lacus]MRX71822.1 beta-glucosidase [Metabacillus lacus]
MGNKKLMKSAVVTSLVGSLLLGTGSYYAMAADGKTKAAPVYLQENQSIEKRVKALLKEMTLKEKVGQMTQINATVLMGNGDWDRGPLNEQTMKKVLKDNHVGSILSGGGASPLPNNPEEWAKLTNAVQKYALENSRLKIPIIYGVDAVHGHNNIIGATLYPHNIGLSTSWNRSLVKEVNKQTAKEVRATGVHWNFSPVGDVARDIRWGRYYETFGEDPYLVSEMNEEAVIGQQGKDISKNNAVAATGKHFIGYSQPFNGMDRAPGDMSARTLREVFLPPFEAQIKAGVKTMMINSGAVNGVPVHASKYLLTDLLRKELGFKGVVVSDWEDIIKLVTVHKTAANYKEAIAMSINAGVDMSMVPIDAVEYTKLLIELVNEGGVSQKRIDEAVSRILTLKFELGLFEKPYVNEKKVNDLILNGNSALALQSARESMTLLKNEGNLLPLKKEQLKSIAVIGPGANSISNQMGGWTIEWQGATNPKEQPPGVTILEGIQKAVGKDVKVNFAEGVPAADKENNSAEITKAVNAAVKAAKNSDVVVLTVAEKPYAEGEGNTTTADLSQAQKELVKAVGAAGKKTILVGVTGRPVMMTDAINKSDAFLAAFLPGAEGGTAVADILFGNYNPSGELSFTWPKNIGQVPVYYNSLPGSGYDPLFPFEAGLSYTTYEYSSLKVGANVKKNGNIQVSVNVKNTGGRDGDEIVQIYSDQKAGGILTPDRKLIGFERVSLKAGETKTVTFKIPASQLAVVPGDVFSNSKREVMPGQYEILVEGQKAPFTVN